MAKKLKPKPKPKLHIRDWLIIALFVAVGATNIVWYRTTQGLNMNAENAAKGWASTQTQNAKLQICVDQPSKPCSLSSAPQSGSSATAH
ncbi:MAG TPA: hypothetical protein VMT30_05185 [Candidatus Saccharimonadia bacterium]|nr:hypothetical protein [Candidatus Saccharimonadia bacterium]